MKVLSQRIERQSMLCTFKTALKQCQNNSTQLQMDKIAVDIHSTKKLLKIVGTTKYLGHITNKLTDDVSNDQTIPALQHLGEKNTLLSLLYHLLHM